MISSPILRIRLITVGFLLIAALLSVRLFFVQVVNGDAWRLEAEEKYMNQSGLLYNRGSIYFKEKDGKLISAASLRSGYKLVINPSLVTEAESVYEKLNNIIPINKEDFLMRAGKKDDPYEEVAKHIEEDTAKKIAALELSGVSMPKEQWRFYPGGNMAAHVLGFVGHKDDEYSGRYGLERYYNDALERNKDGLYNNFFAEIFSGVNNLISKKKIRKEADLILTIEPSVQGFLEGELKNINDKYYPDVLGGIIMDPITGEIMAMASYPDFNPGQYNIEEDLSIFTNPLVENIYEFGSIVKPLTIAAGLDAGAINETDKYTDNGYLIMDGKRIGNFDGKARGYVSMQEVLNQSLNTGAVHVMQKMGRQKFRDYMLAYGLGEQTMIDLPDEVSGLVDNLKSKRDIEYATISYGHGIAVTPIEMTRALASLANGGILVRPHVVAEFDYKGFPGRVVRTEEQEKVLRTDTSERISKMLVTVVDEALAGGGKGLPRYSIAAKTGTAQLINPDGVYYENKFLHSFFGYFPAYEPRFIVFLFVSNPQGARYASQTLTEPFMNTARFLLNYYEILPDR